MDRIAFYGNIKTDDSEAVARLLRDWLKIDQLDVRIGRAGVEIVYEDEGFYLYCHEAVSFYLLEGHRDGTPDAANARLRELAQLCAARGLGCGFEYVQVNEDGDEVSEQFSVK